jgi:DNA-binding HxlR family transcriptional regulator
MPKTSSKNGSKPSVLNARCLSRLVLDRIADKWTALIIRVLSDGIHRYAELQRKIDGISQKMLTQTLRSLERDGLVRRTIYPVVPPRVEYALTPLGRTLIEPLQAICKWSEKHLSELEANRAKAAKQKVVAAPSAFGADRGLVSVT